jgi:hypothetical protein
VVEIAVVWGLFLIGAGVYWRLYRAAERRSPPLPHLDSLLTATFRAGVSIGGWGSTGNRDGQVRLDPHHLVLEVSKSHRAVVPRAQVRRLVDRGVLGWLVDHAGDEELTFNVRGKDGFAASAARLGWPVQPGGQEAGRAARLSG